VTSVTFKKTVSDGNYGSEVAEVTLEVDDFVVDDVPLTDPKDIGKACEEAIGAALATARRLVHDELGQSPSSNVRRALEYPKPEPVPLPVNGADTPNLEDLPF